MCFFKPQNIFFLTFFIIIQTSAYSQNADADMIFLKLELEINPEVRFLKGKATEFFRIKNKSEKKLPVKLDLSDSLKVLNVLYGKDTLEFSHKNNFLEIKPQNSWKETDSVSVVYQGNPTKTGLGSVCYSAHDGIPVFWTLSEPYGAKDWVPIKQDISDKIDSVFITIKCPEKYKAVSNGKLFKETVKKNIRTTEWRHKYPCAYYLIAVAVTQYKVYSEFVVTGKDTVEIVNYVYPERYEQCRRKTWKLSEVFKMFCDSLCQYPFIKEKYGHAQFGWQGGMEHQTISFLSDFSLDLMIHELAHQWFGDMVTCKSWSDIFLNEGFATYCEYLAAEKGLGQTSDLSQWRKAMIKKACRNPQGCLNAKDTLNIGKLFDTSLRYSKGAMVIHLLRREIGDAAFFKTLREYLNNKTFKYSNACAKDFFNLVSKVSGKNLDWFFMQWFYGSGYPIYDVKWQQTSDGLLNIKIIQTPSDSSVSFFKCKVPLTVFGSDGERIILKLNNTYQGQTFTMEPGFNVRYIVFDTEGEILTQNPKIEKAVLCTNCYPAFKIESSNASYKINILNLKKFSFYTLKSINSANQLRGRITGNGKIEIKAGTMPEGEYILQLEGINDYYATKIDIYYKKRKKEI